MSLVHSLWNSEEFVSRLNFIIQIIGACIGVLIVLVGYHLSSLQEAKAQPRTITPEQKTAFAKFLENRPKGPVRVMSISTTNEVKQYVNEIRSMLDEAGCGLPPDSTVRIVLGDVSVSNNPGGTAILVRSLKNAPAHAGSVQKAFESIKIPMPGIEVTTEQTVVLPGEVVVFVAERY